MNSALQKGDIGEYVCAICLLEMGVNCKIVNVDATDILATINNKFVRIQVKSSYYHYRNDVKNGTPFYRFSTAKGKNKTPITKEHCDIVALVALDIKKTIFCVPFNKSSAKYLRPKFLVPNVEKDTWNKCLSKLKIIK